MPEKKITALYEGGEEPEAAEEPKKQVKNPMEKKADKHKDKLDAFDLRQASPNIGDKVINMKPREKTDFWCCGVLAFTTCLTLGFAVYGFVGGGTRAFAPFDAYGNQCGHSAGFEEYPYLYFAKTDGENLWDQIACVKECVKKDSPLECMIKVEGTKNDTYLEECPETATYSSEPAGLLCAPSKNADGKYDPEVEAAMKALKKDALDSEGGKQVVSIVGAVRSMAICIFTAGLLSLMYIYAMANFATCIAYTVIAVVNLIFAALVIGTVALPIDGDQGNKTMILAGQVFGWVVFNAILYCKWKQIKIAIAVVDATADFFVATKRINFVSIAYFMLMVVWVVFWATCMIFMLSIGEYEQLNGGGNTHQDRQIVMDSASAKVAQGIGYFMIFSFIWHMLFIKELNVFVLMGSVSTFYFDSNAQGEGQAQVMMSVKWAHTSHVGSIALGSFIHTLLVIFVYPLLNNAEELAASGNPGAKILGLCLMCFLKCIEELVEYLNKVAYAYMAITGDKYCTSAWNGFLINLKHLCQFYLANQLAAGFVKLGTFFIVMLNMAIFTAVYVYGFQDSALQETDLKGEALKNLKTQILVTNIGAFIMMFLLTLVIIEVFLGLFDEAVVSTLHCMALDMELNGGKPAYGPPSFHEKINEAMKSEEGEDNQEKGQDAVGTATVMAPGGQN